MMSDLFAIIAVCAFFFSTNLEFPDNFYTMLIACFLMQAGILIKLGDRTSGGDSK